MQTPQEQWESYRDTVYKDSLPLIAQQEKECSLAFFAGIASVIGEMVKIPDHLEEETMEEFMEQLRTTTQNTHQYF